LSRFALTSRTVTLRIPYPVCRPEPGHPRPQGPGDTGHSYLTRLQCGHSKAGEPLKVSAVSLLAGDSAAGQVRPGEVRRPGAATPSKMLKPDRYVINTSPAANRCMIAARTPLAEIPCASQQRRLRRRYLHRCICINPGLRIAGCRKSCTLTTPSPARQAQGPSLIAHLVGRVRVHQKLCTRSDLSGWRCGNQSAIASPKKRPRR